jgi:hypothetical protein
MYAYIQYGVTVLPFGGVGLVVLLVITPVAGLKAGGN